MGFIKNQDPTIALTPKPHIRGLGSFIYGIMPQIIFAMAASNAELARLVASTTPTILSRSAIREGGPQCPANKCRIGDCTRGRSAWRRPWPCGARGTRCRPSVNWPARPRQSARLRLLPSRHHHLVPPSTTGQKDLDAKASTFSRSAGFTSARRLARSLGSD